MKDAFMSLTSLGVNPDHRGKVRETVDLGDHLWIVTTDRISAFDCVMPEGLTGKGILLNQLAAFWFRGLEQFLPTHFVACDDAEMPSRFDSFQDRLRGRWMLVRKADRLPIECVVRGYLTGSGWSEYRETGSVCGIRLPEGLREFDRLPQPTFTPTTKEDVGHDRPMSPEETRALLGADIAARVERLSIETYQRAAQYALARGIVIADTKFEFGWIDGRLSLIDEALTPDSSRFWTRESLETRPEGWKAPVSLDKQYVRDYLKTLDWNREPPAPALPPHVEAEALARYARSCDSLTEGGTAPVWGDIR